MFHLNIVRSKKVDTTITDSVFSFSKRSLNDHADPVYGGWTEKPPLLLGYVVKETLTHNPNSFTEGFAFRLGDNKLVESVGLRQKSHISVFDMHIQQGDNSNSKSGNPKELFQQTNQGSEFGEGLTFFQDEDSGKELLIQLTYKAHQAHIYRLENNHLNHIETLMFPDGVREGWGITTSSDRRVLVMSDGSPVLHFLRRHKGQNKLEIVQHITVHDCFNGMPAVKGLNELELVPRYITHQRLRMHLRGASPWWEDHIRIHGSDDVEEFIWANVIGTWCVAVIHPLSGQVVAWINTANLDSHFTQFDKVENGIALRVTDDTIWMTGKKWPNIYRIELGPNHGFKASQYNKGGLNIAQICKTPWRAGSATVGKEEQCLA